MPYKVPPISNNGAPIRRKQFDICNGGMVFHKQNPVGNNIVNTPHLNTTL